MRLNEEMRLLLKWHPSVKPTCPFSSFIFLFSYSDSTYNKTNLSLFIHPCVIQTVYEEFGSKMR